MSEIDAGCKKPLPYWIRCASGFIRDKVIVSLKGEMKTPKSVAAAGALWHLVAVSSELGTDGVLTLQEAYSGFTRNVTEKQADACIELLLECGFITIDQRGNIVIRSYSKWQNTTKEIEELKQKRSEAGKKAANIRWGNT